MMQPCKDCRREIASSARRCPYCGSYQWTTGRIVIAVIILVPVIIALLSIIMTQ